MEDVSRYVKVRNAMNDKELLQFKRFINYLSLSGRDVLELIGAVGQGVAKVGLHTVWQSRSQVNAVLFKL